MPRTSSPHRLALLPAAIGRRCVPPFAVLIAALGTAASAHASDRGFELVSPPDDQGYSAQGYAAQPDGDGFYWRSPGGVQAQDPAPADGARSDFFLARRTTDGWAQSWVTPDPAGVTPTTMEPAAVPGLSADGVTFTSLAGPGNFFPYSGLYRGTATSASLLSAPSGAAAEAGLDTTQWLASDDLGTTVFATSAPLDPADADGAVDLYVRRGDAVELLSRRTDGTPDDTGIEPFLPLAGGDPSGVAAYYSYGWTGFPGSQGASPLARAGDAIVFGTTAQLDADDTDAAADLYLWRAGQDVSLISDDERATAGCPTVPGGTTDCDTPIAITGMADDAATIYFGTDEPLVDADTDGGSDLYEYRPDAPAGHRLRRASGDGAAPVYPLTVTEDGTAFFVSVDRLGSAPPPSGPEPVLYRWKQGTISTVAVLADRDVFDALGFVDAAGLAGNIGTRPIRATADGETVVFRTAARLDPVHDHDAVSDLYRWRPGHGPELLTGDDPQPVVLGANSNGPGGGTTDIYGNGRGITADGSSVFFTTTGTLTADAGNNGRAKLYVWREGDGIRLVSPPGDEAGAVTYIDNATSGRDVFFMTGDPLSARDVDGDGIDVYDARLGGGFSDPVPPVPCQGDPCQGPARSAPLVPTAGTTTFGGPGNQLARPTAQKGVKVSPPKATRTASLSLRVALPGPGRVSVSGSGLRPVSRKASRAATYTLKVKLTARQARARRRTSPIRLKAHVRFVPAAGPSSSVTVPLTFKRAHVSAKKGR